MSAENQEHSAAINRRLFFRTAIAGGAIQTLSGLDAIYNVLTRQNKGERDIPLAKSLAVDAGVFVGGGIVFRAGILGIAQNTGAPARNEQPQTPPQP